MKIYRVGGAVRDQLLGIPYAESDWLVEGTTEAEMLEQGFQRVKADFPVYLHPETGEEYALARRERKSGPGYQGFETDTDPDVSVEEDLARRDLTINAIAEDAAGHLIDPYHGQDDLSAGLLRHVTDAFVEDPVRLLRIARFASRLGVHGFHIAHATHRLLKEMAQSDDLLHLKPERIWREMKKALSEEQPWRFFEVLYAAGALRIILPGLAKTMDQSDQAPGHGSGDDADCIKAMKRAVDAGLDPEYILAVCLSFVVQSGDDVADLAANLCLEKGYGDRLWAILSVKQRLDGQRSMTATEILGLLKRQHAFRQGPEFGHLLAALVAVNPDDQEMARVLKVALTAAGQIDPKALKEAGFQGADLGAELDRRRISAIEQNSIKEPSQ